MSLLVLWAIAALLGGLRLATFVVSCRRDDYADPIGRIFQDWFAPQAPAWTLAARPAPNLAHLSLKRIDHR